MLCAGCKSGEIDPGDGTCRFCGRAMTPAEYRDYHMRIIAPRKKQQDELEDMALRGVT